MAFGQIAHGRLVSFGRIACKWFFCLCRIVWKNMMEMGRGGACVPARVALQGRIRRSSPAHNACIFVMETPLPARSGGHIGTAPTNLHHIFSRIPHKQNNHLHTIHPNETNSPRAIHPNDINHPRAIYPNETVGAAPVCPPERPHSGVSIRK